MTGTAAPFLNARFRGFGAALFTLAALLVSAAPASALNCGALDQPVCREAPAPGVELQLGPAENPHRLEPLSAPLSPDRPLWPRVRGHKPYGLTANPVASGTTPEEGAYLTQQAGGSLARIDVSWGMVQYFPNWGAGGKPWNYEGYVDASYRAYVARGIRPLLTIVATPRRFTRHVATAPNSRVMGCGTLDVCWNPPRSEEAYRLATFAADLATRYPLAAAIELWNEPNLSNPFWGGDTPDPEHYARMLSLVHGAVKRVRPDMPVVGGALAKIGRDGTDSRGYTNLSIRTFVRRMLAAGAAAKMDALSYHPYTGPYPTRATTRRQRNQWFWNTIASADKQVVSAYADAGQAMRERVVTTEVGASTTDGYTEQQQFETLYWQFWFWDTGHAHVPLASRTDGALFFQTVESPTARHAYQRGFGWTRVKDAAGRFAPKAVYCGFRMQLGGFATCPASLAPRDPAAPQLSRARRTCRLPRNSGRRVRGRLNSQRGRTRAARTGSRRCPRWPTPPARRVAR